MDDPLARYVTNTDRDVFALRDLPEEVIAVLFAYYSRSRDDLRANLRKLIADQDLAGADGSAGGEPDLAVAREKARAFHEKWVVGYGHASVAEHAVVHLAVERCSIIAAKALEDARLAAYTEKSTRYVRFDEGTLVTDIGLPRALQAVYETSSRRLLALYGALADEVEASLAHRHPALDGMNAKAHSAALRAHACDLLRGLLPAGVPTNVGVTINARALEHHVGKLLGSPLLEVRRLGGAMKDEASHIVPTLLKYTSPSAHRVGADERVRRAHGHLHSVASDDQHALAKLVDFTHDPLRTLGASIRMERFGGRWDEAWRLAHDLNHSEELVKAYLADRGRHDQPLRALEQVQLRFELCCDYGAWRDLQRHRLLSSTTPLLGTEEGWWLSPELDELGVGPAVREALVAAQEAHHAIYREHPWEAQYAVPLAFRVRWLASMNLRELFHLVELRSARQGHEAYRKVAQAMAREVLATCPWLEPLLRVDWSDYPFARH